MKRTQNFSVTVGNTNDDETIDFAKNEYEYGESK